LAQKQGAEFRLHPLIHTLLEFNLSPSIGVWVKNWACYNDIPTGGGEMKIEIIEGVEIDISGPLRKLRLRDGWYVVGEGSLDTVDSEEEADLLIQHLTT
jgi:hypothetical protein